MNSSFISSSREPEDGGKEAIWFVFRGSRLLVNLDGGGASLPRENDREKMMLSIDHRQYLGSQDGLHCYAADVPEGETIPEGWSFQGLRRLYSRMEEPLFAMAGRAVQLVDWDRTNQFCGRCGAPTQNHPSERAKECTACGLIRYPRISPAIIVLVRNKDKLLLARAHRHPPGFYSVLAGFVEPGETLEETVTREIREEVGIEVQNIEYFGSQPWPFPNSLMIAFVCDYAGGEIAVQEDEIEDAGWYNPAQLPPVPPKISIARQMIDWFAVQQSQ
jgi:NAD+ diphosphatase